jgi:hypothetical protein
LDLFALQARYYTPARGFALAASPGRGARALLLASVGDLRVFTGMAVALPIPVRRARRVDPVVALRAE